MGLLFACLAGCAAAPGYRTPDTTLPARYTAQPLPDATAGQAEAGVPSQRFIGGAELPIDWWTVYGSAELDALVRRALERNPTVAAAEAALRAANEMAAAQRGSLLPSVDASYGATRAGTPGVLSPPLSSQAAVYTLHTAQLNVGYVVDVFGASRHAVQVQDAGAEAQRWQWRAARLTLSTSVVTAALQEASLRDQLATTERLVGMADRQWQLLATQQRLGAVPGAAVHAQEALLRQGQAAAAGLRKQLAQQRAQLAVLAGDLPADGAALRLNLSDLRLADVPLRLPSQLLAQRPDIRAAEAQFRAASEQAGVAEAARLPQITLGAALGSSAQSLGGLFGSGALLWNLGANLTQPLFQGGALRHRSQAALAQRDQALAQYQGTVLVAFQNVSDALEAVRHDAEQQVAVVAQVKATERALQAAQRQVELGDISTFTLLNSEPAYLQAALAGVQARAGRLGDVALLVQALGGSWEPAAAR